MTTPTEHDREALVKLLRECLEMAKAESRRHPKSSSCEIFVTRVQSTIAALTAQGGEQTADTVSVPRKPTDEWAERFCKLVNWHPDGTENKFVEGTLHSVTFRDLAKGYIRAVLAAAKGGE